MSFGIPVRNGLGVGLLASTSLATRNRVFTPASLFAAGEQGYWLDPSDFSTMWQDNEGVTPVTATGQTCGLILDKRIGTRTQVFNDANVTFGGPTGYAGRISPGVYEYARDAGGVGSVTFGGLTTGNTYLVSVQLSAYAGAIPGITATRADFFSALNVSTRPFANTAGTYTFFYLADGSNFVIRAGGPGNGGTISNVSILDVPGNHFLQATAASRPIVQTDGVNRFVLFDGTDDGLVSAATINPGAVDKAQVFAGVRKLSDAGFAPVVMEVSASPGVNNGVLGLNTNSGSGSPADYSGISRGTVGIGFDTANVYAAPITNVLTLLGDISGDSAILRVNGVQAASNTGDQGTGNYLTYPHFIGRRNNATLPLNGRIYQMIMRYGANLTAAQISQTETFVNSKTGAY
jgi:hypothetical protein